MQVNITADISRRIETQSFQQSSVMAFKIPRDSTFKALQLRLKGALTTTFASGTPVAENRSTMANLINYIDINANGGTTLKNVTPWMMHIQQLMATVVFGVRKASAGASAASPAENVTADSKFVYGTTGQITSVVESIIIFFENVMSSDGMKTLWDTRGLASAEMKLATGAYSALLGYANTAPVVYSDSTLQVELSSIETQSIPNNVYFATFKQTTKSKSFTAQVSDELVDINRGNFLQGIMIEAHDGAAGSTTTASGKVLSNILLTDLKLIINGSLYLQNTTFGDLQDKNRNRYGINAAYSSNVSLMDGMAYLDLLSPKSGHKFGSIHSAQDLRAPNVDSCQLAVSTSSVPSYTATAYINVMTNEIVPPQA